MLEYYFSLSLSLICERLSSSALAVAVRAGRRRPPVTSWDEQKEWEERESGWGGVVGGERWRQRGGAQQ